jgi:hypothetical protein
MGRGPKQSLPRNKKLNSNNTMLIFPDFNKDFEIHTDASDYQLGLVISQDQKPIVFYSLKTNRDSMQLHSRRKRDALY